VELAPGVLFTPSAFTEIGYDSNPNQLFGGQDSGYSRTGAGFRVRSISDGLVASLAANGSWISYFADDVGDAERLSGSAQANVTYLLQPGWTVSAVGFVDRDSQSYNKSESDGGSVETGFSDKTVTVFARGRYSEVRYLNDGQFADTPLLLSSAFNSNRTEASWGGLYGNNSRVAFYAEGSAAQVDYTNQANTALINRDANDYSLKGGTRLTVSPTFQADLGWRFNWRSLQDTFVRDYDSNFFDGSFRWRPSPFFYLSSSVQRIIGEPSAVFGRLSDIRSYDVKLTFLPVQGVTLAVAAGRQLVNNIGADYRYHSTVVDGSLSYDYTNHVQLYTAVRYEDYSIDWKAQEYDRFRVLAGVRFIPDGNSLGIWDKGGGLKDPFASAGTLRLPSGAALTASVGYSWFDLPATKLTTLVGGPFFDQATGTVTNHDGGLGGVRTDVRLAEFAEHPLSDGYWLSFGASGFYGRYEGSQRSGCTATATSDCAFVNLVDYDKTQANNTGWGGDFSIKTERSVNYYGASIDARIGYGLLGGYKDEPRRELSPFKVGIGFRGLDETTKLRALDPAVCQPVNYKDTLDTHYYGGFVGYERKFDLSDGWTFNVDATAGLYYTDTEYQGKYSGYSLYLPGSGAPFYVQDFGVANGSLERGSFIGGLRVGLNKSLSWGNVGVYGQGEYLSYAPKIAYNSNDQAVWLSAPIDGQSGTRIKSDDAFNFTSGLSISVPLN